MLHFFRFVFMEIGGEKKKPINHSGLIDFG